MDIGLLKTFLEVRKMRNFGRAADNLFITQAAVSARIKQLEDYFGAKLFLRQRNNLQLTAEGERLVPHAETILQAWARAKQEVELKLEQRQQLSIGSTAGLWSYAYQDRLAKVAAQMPEVALRTEVHAADELLRLVIERALDLAILYDAPNMPELATKPLEKLKLVLASTIPDATAKSAVQANYIYVDWGTAFNIFHAKRYSESAPAMHYTTNASIAEAMLKNMSASAYLPQNVIAESSIAGLKPVADAPTFNREVFAIYRSGHVDAELITAVVAQLYH